MILGEVPLSIGGIDLKARITVSRPALAAGIITGLLHNRTGLIRRDELMTIFSGNMAGFSIFKLRLWGEGLSYSKKSHTTNIIFLQNQLCNYATFYLVSSF